MERRDEDLIIDYQNGDKTAMEILFNRYKKPVFNFALRILSNRADAEDTTSEVMLILATKGDSYSNNPNAKFSTWLFAITRNTCINQIRKQKRTVSMWFNKTESDEYQEWDIPDTEDLPQEELAKKESALKVRKAIHELPLSQKEALVLREYQKLSYAEISEVLNCSVDNVKILIYRAREELRNKLSSFIMEGNNE